MNDPCFLLCIDTSTPVGSLALLGSRGLIAGQTRSNPAAHTEKLFSLAEQMLQDCGLELDNLGGIAVAAGPGSFTGLRIAAATAKTLAWSTGKPLYAAGTLESLAWGAAAPGVTVLALLDAGHSEFYCAAYLRHDSRGPLEEIFPPCALEAGDLAGRIAEISSGGEIACVGQGVDTAWECLEAANRGRLVRPPARLDLPDAAFLGELVLATPEKHRVENIFAFEPLYVRSGQAQLRLGK